MVAPGKALFIGPKLAQNIFVIGILDIGAIALQEAKSRVPAFLA